MEGSIELLQSRAEANRTMTEAAVRQSREQIRAFQEMGQELTGAYMGLLESVISPWPDEVSDPALLIPDYDSLSIGEVTSRLDGLSDEEIQRLKEHERRGKNRESLIRQLDCRLEGVSSAP